MEQLKAVFLNWDGRLNRIQYFGYSVATILAALFLIMILVAIGSANNAAAAIAFLFGTVVFAFYAYAGMTITVKRLHDIGFGAINVLWIWLINFSSGAFSGVNNTISILFSIVGIGISLYLLFAPGVAGTNQYGDQPE